MAYEVAHGEVRISLSDQEAIAGLRNLDRQVDRTLREIDGKDAEVRVSANLKELKRNLKEAEALEKAHQKNIEDLQKQRAEKGLSPAEKGLLTKRINAAEAEAKAIRDQIPAMRERAAHVQKHVDGLKKTNHELAVSASRTDAVNKAQDRLNKKIEDAGRLHSRALAMNEKYDESVKKRTRNEGLMYLQAERMMKADLSNKQAAIQSEGRMMSQARAQFERDMNARARAYMDAEREGDRRRTDAIMGTRREESEVAKLQARYAELSRTVQHAAGRGKFRRAVSPETAASFEINQTRALAEMEVLRAKLKAMNANAIDIPVNLNESGLLKAFASLGDVAVRIGPFTASMGQLLRISMVLGPALVGTIGGITALAGALGVGLVGAAGVAGTALLGLGGVLGGVFLAVKPIATHFKAINKASKAYADAVAKYGKESDKAKEKLDQFNSVTKHMSPLAREAFKELGGLNKQWKALTASSRKTAMEGMAEGVRTVSDTMPMLARNTNRATEALSGGFTKWMRGLRGVQGQSVIDKILHRTTDAIPPLMDALGELGAWIGKVTASFSRHFKPLAEDFKDWAAGLNAAADNTTRLDGGVDKLVGAFRSTVEWVSAASRVIKELFRGALGPGQDGLGTMTDGMNRLADSMGSAAGQRSLHDFFTDAVDMMQRTYNVLQPLVALFLEYTTIMRPFTVILLDVVGAFAELLRKGADIGIFRAAMVGLFGLWLFKRGTASTISLIAGAIQGVASALRAVGAAGAGAKLASLVPAGGAGAIRPGMTSGSPLGPGMPGGSMGAPPKWSKAAGGAGFWASRRNYLNAREDARFFGNETLPAAQRARSTLAATPKVTVPSTLFTGLGKGANAASLALLGIPGPVAGVAAAAAGAIIGLNKLRDAEEDRAAELYRIAPNTYPDGPKRQGGISRVFGGLPVVNPMEEPIGLRIARTILGPSERTKQAQRVGADLRHADDLTADRGTVTRGLADQYSQLSTAQLRFEAAQKNAHATAKRGGIEHRQALLELSDAQRDLTSQQDLWAASTKRGMTDSDRIVKTLTSDLQIAKDMNLDPRDIDRYKRALENAKNAASGFRVNMERARAGTSALVGADADKVGKFARSFQGMPGFKRLVVNVEDTKAVTRIADIGNKLQSLGRGKTVAKIIADADDPNEAIRRLNAALNRLQNRDATTKLKADKKQIERDLAQVNNRLDKLHGRKPSPWLATRKKQLEDDLAWANQKLNALNGKKVTPKVAIRMSVEGAISGLTNVFGDGPSGGTGDRGAGNPLVGAVSKEATGYAKQHEKEFAKKLLSSPGLGDAGAGSPKGGVDTFNDDAAGFGLQITSGFRSGDDGWHGANRARDYSNGGGPTPQMMAFAKYMFSRFGGSLLELIYSPLGVGIKNGKPVPIGFFGQKVVADHYDHVHVAYAQGGVHGDGRTVRSGRYTNPTNVLFAEEPGHPEYFISTNPRDRKRSQGLIAQAASEVGMSSVKAGKGGLISDILSKALKAAPELSKYNRVFPRHFLENTKGKTQLTPTEVRAVFESVGFSARDALNMSRISKRESRRFPGMQQHDPGDGNVGYGLVQNTPHAWSPAAKKYLARLGGINAMRNPILNAAMAKFLFDHGGYAHWASSTNPVSLKMKGKVESVLTKFGGGRKGSASEKEREKATMGSTSSMEATVAQGDNRLAAATRNNDQQGVIDAIFGKMVKYNAPTSGGISAAEQDASPMMVRRPGLYGVLGQSIKADKKRLRQVNRKLSGPLTPTKRSELLSERTSLITNVGSSQARRDELRTQGRLAKFERGRGPLGNRQTLDYFGAIAAGTETIDDDMKIAEADVGYWDARAKWAAKNGDVAGATEAITNRNSAAERVKTLGQQKVTDLRTIAENTLSVQEGLASLTAPLFDDLEAANNAVNYWQGQLDTATTDEDRIRAISGLGTSKGRVADISKNITFKPLERERALAALTDQTDDDVAATTKLRDAWQKRLDDLLASGGSDDDIIEAAGQVAGLNNDLKSASQSIAAQFQALGTARYELYKSFGSNFNSIPTVAPYFGNPTPAAASSTSTSTVTKIINQDITVQGNMDDPHLWAQGTRFELEAAL